jgi:ABC-type nickel/cobalt efflux system permease component RcnA
METVSAGLLLALVLGARHALEPDHLAAVSTLLAGRAGSRRAALLGASWGLGHALALLLAAGTLVLARAAMPERLAAMLELGVAGMLVLLGSRNLWLAFRAGREGPAHGHLHGAVSHAHPGAPEHVHLGAFTLARRPLLVGLVHGLAGSGALAALAASQMPSLAAGLAFVLSFGAGALLGMAALAGAAGIPLARLGTRPGAVRALGVLSGVVSLGLGLHWGAQTARLLAG